MRKQTEAWTCGILFSGLATLLLSGCGGSDLSEYRPVEKTNSQSAKQSASPPSKAESPPDNVPAPGTQIAVASTTAESAAETDTIASEVIPVSALAPLNVVDGTSVKSLMKVVIPGGSTPSPLETTSASAAPHQVELLIPEKTFRRDASSKALRVSYDDLDLLKVLNLEPVTDNAVELMPTWLKELDGQRIRIRGFMYPTFEAEGIEMFALARDNQICCFGRDPKVYDLVQVDLREGRTTEYIPPTRAFDVVGKFKIKMATEDGKPYELYHLQDAEIIDR